MRNNLWHIFPDSCHCPDAFGQWQLRTVCFYFVIHHSGRIVIRSYWPCLYLVIHYSLFGVGYLFSFCNDGIFVGMGVFLRFSYLSQSRGDEKRLKKLVVSSGRNIDLSRFSLRHTRPCVSILQMDVTEGWTLPPAWFMGMNAECGRWQVDISPPGLLVLLVSLYPMLKRGVSYV